MYRIDSKHSDIFVVLAHPCLLLIIFYILSRVFTGVKETKTKKNNGRDQRLGEATREGRTTGASSVLLFVFLSFLLLALLPNYLPYREVGFDRRHGGRSRTGDTTDDDESFAPSS